MGLIDSILQDQKFKAGIEGVLQSPIVQASELIRVFNLQNVHVLKSPPVPPYNLPAPIPADSPITGQSQPYLGTTLNIPVVTDLTINVPGYNDNNGKSVAPSSIKMACVLITVSQAKNIVKTQIQGRDGTVKEYIGMGDYDITVNGIITGTNGSYPAAAMKRLHNVNIAPLTVEVESTYLTNFGITNIVIEKFDYTQDAGGYSQQKFTLSCISDNPVNLIITFGKNGNTFVGPQQPGF